MPGNRRGGGAAPTPSELVEAMLAGTDSFAIDPTDPTTMWTTSAKATLVAAPGDPIGAIRTKWGNAQFDFTQSTAGARPAWNGLNGIVSDGVDDELACLASIIVDTDKAAMAYVGKHRRDGAGAGAQIFAFLSTPTAGTSRFRLDVQNGRLRYIGLRLDADSGTVIDNAGAGNGGTVSTEYTTTVLVNNATTGAVTARLNGAASSLSGTLAGSVANSQNTTSARATICGQTGGRFLGTLGRMVFLSFTPTPGQIDALEAWVNEGGAF